MLLAAVVVHGGATRHAHAWIVVHSQYMKKNAVGWWFGMRSTAGLRGLASAWAVVVMMRFACLPFA